MNKKHFFIRLCKVGSLLLALVLTLGFLQEYVLCRADNNRERIKGFYLEDRDTIDVVLIGASEVYTGYAAPYAYGKYGFTSYPIATQSNTILNYLTCVKEAVRTQHPRLLVIEINGALYDDRRLNDEANLLRIADSMPNNANKRELTDQFDFYDTLDAYLPIMRYHTVWQDFPIGLEWSASLLMSHFRGHNLLKGVSTTTQVFHSREKLYNDELAQYDKKPLTARCREALTQLLEYCKSEKLNVVFTRFPHLVDKKGLIRYRRSLEAAELIRSYGFAYYGLDEKMGEIGLDPDSDFYGVEHVNLYGQQKLTDYLCGLIKPRLGDDAPRLSDHNREEWEDSFRWYGAYYALADRIIRSGGENRRIAEDVVSLWEMRQYLES